MTTRQDPFARDGSMATYESQFEKNTQGMVLSAQSPNYCETVACFIVGGQSLSCSANGEVGDPAYVPANLTKCDQLNIDDGGIYTAKEPMLGCSTYMGSRNSFIRLADKLVTAGYRQRVVLINIGIGSTSSAQWKNTLYPRIVIANERAKAKGFTVNAVLWQQGEDDNVQGTDQATYLANMNSLIAKVRGQGVSAPWIVAKSTYSAGTTSAPVRAAVDQLANGVDVFVGPDCDTLTGTNRNAGNVHLSVPTGVDNASTLWRDSILALLP